MPSFHYAAAFALALPFLGECVIDSIKVDIKGDSEEQRNDPDYEACSDIGYAKGSVKMGKDFFKQRNGSGGTNQDQIFDSEADFEQCTMAAPLIFNGAYHNIFGDDEEAKAAALAQDDRIKSMLVQCNPDYRANKVTPGDVDQGGMDFYFFNSDDCTGEAVKKLEAPWEGGGNYYLCSAGIPNHCDPIQRYSISMTIYLESRFKDTNAAAKSLAFKNYETCDKPKEIAVTSFEDQKICGGENDSDDIYY